MAIKLSSYLWLRNNWLEGYISQKPAYRLIPELSPEELAVLRRTRNELDGYHSISDIEGEYFPQIIERSMNPGRSGELFFQIHQVFRSRFIPTEVYRCLGKAHTELGIEPQDPEFRVVIVVATTAYEAYHSLYRQTTVHAESEFRKQSREKERA